MPSQLPAYEVEHNGVQYSTVKPMQRSAIQYSQVHAAECNTVQSSPCKRKDMSKSWIGGKRLMMSKSWIGGRRLMSKNWTGGRGHVGHSQSSIQKQYKRKVQTDECMYSPTLVLYGLVLLSL